jgi:CDP-paratose 2-epimerase
MVNASLLARNEDLPRPDEGHVLITGGAGFIGTNLAHRLLLQGRRVVVLDDLSRAGAKENLACLMREHRGLLAFARADIRDAQAVANAIADAGAVFHLAAQVAVAASFADPRRDFDINVGGTVNVLEAIRQRPCRPPLIFTSTSKIYGALGGLSWCALGSRYEPEDGHCRRFGIGESRPLEPHTPHGCSKSAADQYVLDYARSFNLPALCFRLGDVYGPHQCGMQDHGFVAHFLSRAVDGLPLTIYGDGKQVRDLLFIDDLVDALLLAWHSAYRLRGRAFNIGGGPENAVSLLELLDAIEEIHGARPELELGDWRPGDQRYYVSDIRAFKEASGWSPQVGVDDGLQRLHRWLLATRLPAGSPAQRVAP